jgi:hypothetical protein
MPVKRKTVRKTKTSTRRLRGGDFLGIGNFFRNKVGPALKKGFDFVKDNKLISKGLNLVGQNKLGALAGQVGLGRRKKRTTKKTGARRIRGGAVTMIF